jgi:hypothetical protein
MSKEIKIIFVYKVSHKDEEEDVPEDYIFYDTYYGVALIDGKYENFEITNDRNTENFRGSTNIDKDVFFKACSAATFLKNKKIVYGAAFISGSFVKDHVYTLYAPNFEDYIDFKIYKRDEK